ncbi:MAG: C25 family cysteine peptidase, partial [Betaproteobacteria bacterium]
VITIHANCFFVPWGMLYTHPTEEPLAANGSNFVKEGFWGYRHIIEHCPYKRKYGTNRVIHPSDDGRVTTGFHIDDAIKLVDDPDVMARQQHFFAEHPLIDSRERTLKAHLSTALSSDEFNDKLMYFFCHGRGAGEIDKPNLGDSWLKLSDPPDTYITANDFDTWLGDRDLESSPFVFCNACQGGQMTTNFYESVALAMLARGAAGLIGPQIDVPIVFAEKFGRRFFERLLGDGQTPSDPAGKILRDLTREFLDNHHNPLGLAYSLYSGADMQFVPRRNQLAEPEQDS